MNDSGQKILLWFKRRWHLLQMLEMLLYGLGPAILVYALTVNSWLAIGIGIFIIVLVIIIRKPWRLTLERVSRYIDKQSATMQYSTGLLLLPREKLSNLALIQRHQVSEIIHDSIKRVWPQVTLRWALAAFALFLVSAFLVYSSDWAKDYQNTGEHPDSEMITFQPLDSTAIKRNPPILISQKLTIRPPSYTKLGPTHQSNMQIKALKGSRIFWSIQFDAPVDSVLWEGSEQDRPMKNAGNGYSYNTVLNASGFYNFRFTAKDGASYQSELYPMEVLQDEPPLVEIRDLKQFVSFSSKEPKIVDLNVSVSDDYGLQDAYIIATVSKGEGESVKFREERMNFDNGLERGTKSQNLRKRIDLDQLDMEPGDELYFYVGLTDTKNPRPNTSRSETYFAVIEDTVSDRFAVESTMGADLMPAYFRSQRQLIIDTKKLIANRDGMTQEKFKATSNALGADQKSLRLKYGQFMGDEVDSGIRGGAIDLEEIEENDDPTADYTHNHDAADHDHQPVEHEHEHEEDTGNEQEESPLENYLHNHDNPEESTLFTQSLKSKLREAMNQMWDAELHLRLYAPEKSLPFQNRALELIQDIKNDARVYVHRIGFDAPPIKEENRLTGEIESVKTVQKQENLEESIAYPAIRKAVKRLEALLFKASDNILLEKADRSLLEAAGRELASLAVKEPGKYLQTLQALKWLSDRAENNKEEVERVRNGLLRAIPPSKPDATQMQVGVGTINELLLQELDSDD